MAEREPLVDELASAILDGSPIDWDGLDTTSSDSDRGLIGELRLLAALADVHRRQPDVAVVDTAAPVGVWGHLHLLERVGGGSFGDVYRARDTRLEREVAVKLMPAPRAGDAETAAIIREARLLARVRHPGVVTVYDAQQIGDHVGLWMELVRGRTLEEGLAERGAFLPAEVIDIGIALCHAVSAVHDAGLLHRDIKTQNVMRADDGRLVLMDFGVGREVTDASMTSVAGTPLYLAPEIFRGEPATVGTDVYAMGVLLFHLLTGTFPVRARTVTELQRVHASGDRQHVLTARPDLPADLAGVVDRAMDPDPGQRFGSAAELAAALDAVRPRVRSRRRLIGVAASIVLVAGAVIAVNRGWLTVGRGPAVLAPQQWILIGAFTGTTGDASLDAALRQAAVSELEASSHVNVFPATWVREALTRMGRPATTRLDEPLGLKIARQEGLGAFVTGSFALRDGTYQIELHATHVATGRTLATPIEARRTREEVMHAAYGLGRQMRVLLGETGPAIQPMSAPIAPVSSQSLDALRHFALGRALYDDEQAGEALPHFLAAAARDPDFAMAHQYASHCYASLADYDEQRAAMARAAALARRGDERLGSIEREKILADDYALDERFEDAAAHLRAALSLRPGDGRMLASLGQNYGSRRQYAPAIEAFEKALQSYPHRRVRWMLADMYSASGHPDAAAALLAPHRERPFDWIAHAKHLLIAGNRTEARLGLDEAERRTHASANDDWSDLALANADFLRSEGRYAAAVVVLQQAVDRAGRRIAERLELALTSVLLESGRSDDAIARLRRIDIGLSRNRIVHGVLAARAGDLDTATAILAQLEAESSERRAPRAEARVHQLTAEIALARRDYARAHVHAAKAVGAFPTTWTLATLARAQQAAGHLSEAIGTWTTILERPGERTIDWDAPAYAQFVLGRYHIARLLEQAGRAGDARAAYDEFLRLWDRADPDLPAVVDARARRARLTPASGQGAQSTSAGRVPKPAA